MAEALIWFAVLFMFGGVLLLERRCLGQMAFAQPLVVCLLGGYFCDQTGTGIWLGISLQLLSVGQEHYADWALAGIIAAAGLFCANIYGFNIYTGTLPAVVLISIAVAAAISGRIIEQRQARIDGGLLRKDSLWNKENISIEIEKMVHRRLVRGFVFGGLQTVIGVFLSVAIISALHSTLTTAPLVSYIVTIAVPSFGVAMAMGSLSRYRFIAYGAAGVTATFAIRYWVF